MNWLRNLLARMAEESQRREQRRYEAFLSDAVDLYDLEHRQRSWDRHQAREQRNMAFADHWR